MTKKTAKRLLFLFFLGVIILLVRSPLLQQLSIRGIKQHLAQAQTYFFEKPFQSIVLYLLIYTFVAGLSLPGAVPLTLAGGAVFGLFWGTLAVSLGSTLGASFAFLATRFFFRDFVQRHFGERVYLINEGLKKEGASYLLALRLIPLFPYFLVNMAMGLSTMNLGTYFWVSQLGMLPASVVYVNAGMELATVDSIAGIFSPPLIISFTLIGLLPLLTKRLLQKLHERRVFKPFTKPKKFDYNMIVIGAGSAGLITSYISAASRAKVALIEKDQMGGECLHRGCVPSKALVKAAHLVHSARHASEFGIKTKVSFDFADIMAQVQERIQRVAPHDSRDRYTQLGVDCFSGTAKILSPWEVEVAGKRLTTRAITLATGARPLIEALPGLDQVAYLSSDTIWSLRDLPKRLVILGGGPIACELAQCFARLGSAVSLVQRRAYLMPREDDEVGRFLQTHFTQEGIRVLTQHHPVECVKEQGQDILICQDGETRVRLPFDRLLIATGRQANVEALGLEALGIKLTHNTLEHDPFLTTLMPNIYACGDLIGPYRFTHVAAYQAWFCAMNGLFGQFWKLRPSYKTIPWCTFTDPEIASVGYNEKTAQEHKIAYQLTRFDLSELDRAITDRTNEGFVQVLTAVHSDRILGATIVASRAGEMILEFVSAMQNKFGLNKILKTLHIYPTYGEANRFVAGDWRKKRLSPKMLEILARYHENAFAC